MKHMCIAKLSKSPFFSQNPTQQELVIWGWTLAIGTGIAVVFGMDVPARYDEGRMPSEVTNAFYGSLHRLAWGLALSWVVWACSKGYGGTVI